MKQCPTCGRTFTDDVAEVCPDDGATLTHSADSGAIHDAPAPVTPAQDNTGSQVPAPPATVGSVREPVAAPVKPWQPPSPPPPVDIAADESFVARLWRRKRNDMMIAGIVIFAVGLVLIVSGIVKVLPGGVGTGGSFVFLGIVLLAFSFIPLPEPAAGDEAPISAAGKLAGIFYEPTRVYRNLRSHPHWLAAFLVIVVLSGIYAAAFVQRLTPERIVDHTFDKMADSPIKPPADKMAEMKEDALKTAKQPVHRIQSFAKSFVGWFTFFSLLSGLYLLGVLAFGGRINFWQAFAATVYSMVPIAIIGKGLSLVILFIKDPDSIHPILNQDNMLQDNLSVLFNPAEHPVFFVLASAIGFLSLYGLWLRATGLQNAGYKVSSSAAWGTTLTFWLLGYALLAVFTFFFASFIS